MARNNGNTKRRGHGHREYTRDTCACGTRMSCKIKRQIRHAGGDPNLCPRCAGATAGMLALVG